MKLNVWIRIGIFMAAGMVAIFFWSGRTHSGLIFVALDVGQGDALYLRTPGGNDILVDGGPANGHVVEALERYMSPSNRTLELVVLTHPDADHVGGLPAVAEHFGIQRVLETDVRASSTAVRRWSEAVTGQSSQVMLAQAGSVIQVDDVRLTVLWPEADAEAVARTRNDTSVVLRVDYGSTSFLLTGDIETVIEDRLMQLGSASDIDVLKVGHHGSITSTSQAFLDVVKPEIAVVSVGTGNAFGHPHPVVVRRLERAGTEVLRTDERGDVVLKSNGQDVYFSP